MTLKYSLILSALFAFSACGVRPEQKAKTQQVADTVVTSGQMTSAIPEVSAAEYKDTLPTYIGTYTKADSALVYQLLQEFIPQRQQLTGDQFIIRIAQKFIGVPYVAHISDVNEGEKPVANLHGLGCTTYVETVTALALCVKRDGAHFSGYVRQLEQVRYHGSKMSYVNRLRYFHWWLEDNERMGFVRRVDTPNPPFTAVRTLRINYMSQNAGLYDMSKNSPERVAELKELEDATNGTKLRCISKSLLNNSKLLRGVVRDGDVLTIVTNKRELDTTHLGLAVQHKDELHLMNASNLRKDSNKVVGPVETLYNYMMTRPANFRIRVMHIQQ